MTYEEAKDATVTAKEARYEIETMHSLCFDSFQQDYGYKDTYQGSDVLDWLGY
jgi:hypothetical protein